MLTLGSVERDASHVGEIERGLRRRLRIASDREVHDRYVRRRLRVFLERVVARHAAYQDPPFAEVLSRPHPETRLADLPRLEKSSLREMTAAFSKGRKPSSYFVARTSGSTGVPVATWFSTAYYTANMANLCCFLHLNDIHLEPLVTGILHLSTFRHGDEFSFVLPALNYSVHRHVRIHPERWRAPGEVAAWVSSEEPVVLGGTPSDLARLADWAAADPPPRPIVPRAVLCYREALLPEMRRHLTEAFQAPVFQDYGLTEVGGPIAFECSEHDGLHVLSADYVVEVADGRGAPVPDGEEGEILVTNLYHRETPILRYRTGDYGVLGRGPCRCGSVTPRILALKGRDITRFVRADGSTYNPHDEYGQLLSALPLRHFQLCQDPDGTLTLSYVATRDVETLPAARALSAVAMGIHGRSLTLRRVQSLVGEGKLHAYLRR